jgi:predicted phosphoribosyltransferase
MIFEDRTDAGRQLAKALISYRGRDPVVYALPRGGVVVGAEIARCLDATLDLVITRKIGHPMSPEYAIAAVGEDGDTVTNPTEIASVDRRWFEQEVSIQQREAQRRRRLYMRDRKPVPARDKVAIIVDDGVATGLTMFAAIQDVRRRGPRRIVVAVPVAPPDTVRKIKLLADEVAVLYSPEEFRAIGSFYARFDQVSDSEVIEILNSQIPSLVE